MNSELSHRSLIKDLTQTAVIYMHCITMHFNAELDVSYGSLQTFLKVMVKMFCSSSLTCLKIIRILLIY